MKSIALLLTLAAGPLAAQSYRVPLQIKTNILQFSFLTYPMAAEDANHLHVDLPGGLSIQAERLPAPLAGIIAHIPEAKPEAVTLLDGQESIVSLNAGSAISTRCHTLSATTEAKIMARLRSSLSGVLIIWRKAR